MDEYIEREAAIDAVTEVYYNTPDVNLSGEKFEAAINGILAADVAPVVRCKDCNHCDPENYHCDHPMSTAAPLRRKPDDFCSYGERKDDADV